MAENGNNLIIALGGTAIAGAKSAEIQTSCDKIEIASASNNTWQKLIAGRKRWNVTVGYLVTLSNTGADLLRVGTIYTLSIKTRAGVVLAHGNALMTDCRIDAATGSLIKGSFAFTGADILNLN